MHKTLENAPEKNMLAVCTCSENVVHHPENHYNKQGCNKYTPLGSGHTIAMHANTQCAQMSKVV